MTKQLLDKETSSTFNISVPITCVNIPNDIENNVCASLRNIFYVMGEYFDLSILKGISIASGDVGYKKAIELIDDSRNPSEGDVEGCAMAITHTTNRNLESYIILKDISIIPLLVENKSENADEIDRMIQIIAHECAHIHSDILLNNTLKSINNIDYCQSHYDQIVHEISTVSYSEFLACYFSAGIGENPEQGFKAVLLGKLKTIENELIFSKTLSNNPLLMLNTVFKHIGNLIKYSSYYLGWMFNNQFNKEIEDTSLYQHIKNSWFLSFLSDLKDIYKSIMESFLSNRLNINEVLSIGHLAKNICEYFDFELSVDDDNRTYFYSINTT